MFRNILIFLLGFSVPLLMGAGYATLNQPETNDFGYTVEKAAGIGGLY